MKVFYSWQSDLPAKHNRSFIKTCIESAIKAINKELLLEVSERQVRIDHDTKDVPGTPDIVASIFDKISSSTIFIADVSFIGKGIINTKNLPNPNVMIELGYAMSTLGSDKIICILNTAYGLPKSLPFDLKYRRFPISFRLNDNVNSDNKKAIKEHFINSLKSAIQLIINLEKYKRPILSISNNPIKQEIIDVIMASDSKNDWEESIMNDKVVNYYKSNVNLRFEIDHSNDIHSNDFIEPWATKHADNFAMSYWCRLYYNHTLIDSYILVAVDGGRALLPLPNNKTELSVKLLDYKIAQIHDTSGALDKYVARSGLKIENICKNQYLI